jgi:hypothetical protein
MATVADEIEGNVTTIVLRQCTIEASKPPPVG